VIVICLFRSWLLISEGYREDADLYAILAAAFAGFLFFNYHPARIFMGDCGSLPAGFALGALTLAGPAPHGPLPLTNVFYPVLTFAYPIFDTALVSVLRKLTGRPISVGGRDHSSHRLASQGLDQRQVVWILWLLTAFGSSLAVVILLGLLGTFALSLANTPGYPRPELLRFYRREVHTNASKACA
jgi:UDP-GlcNAc:undecaprenyl-phosphate GlcNAc-1-phosphate transferase